MFLPAIFPFEVVCASDDLTLSFAVQQKRNLLFEEVFRGAGTFFGEELDQVASFSSCSRRFDCRAETEPMRPTPSKTKTIKLQYLFDNRPIDRGGSHRRWKF